MVQYFLAGRVNSESFAICERLMDIMMISLPDFTATKHSYRPDQWGKEALELKRLYGFALPMSGNLVVCDVVIWSENGRLLCHDADSFATFAQKNYGIIIDLDETELLRHVKFNQEEMKKQIAAEAAAAKAAKANTT